MSRSNRFTPHTLQYSDDSLNNSSDCSNIPAPHPLLHQSLSQAPSSCPKDSSTRHQDTLLQSTRELSIQQSSVGSTFSSLPCSTQTPVKASTLHSSPFQKTTTPTSIHIKPQFDQDLIDHSDSDEEHFLNGDNSLQRHKYVHKYAQNTPSSRSFVPSHGNTTSKFHLAQFNPHLSNRTPVRTQNLSTTSYTPSSLPSKKVNMYNTPNNTHSSKKSTPSRDTLDFSTILMADDDDLDTFLFIEQRAFELNSAKQQQSEHSTEDRNNQAPPVEQKKGDYEDFHLSDDDTPCNHDPLVQSRHADVDDTHNGFQTQLDPFDGSNHGDIVENMEDIDLFAINTEFFPDPTPPPQQTNENTLTPRNKNTRESHSGRELSQKYNEWLTKSPKNANNLKNASFNINDKNRKSDDSPHDFFQDSNNSGYIAQNNIQIDNEMYILENVTSKGVFNSTTCNDEDALDQFNPTLNDDLDLTSDNLHNTFSGTNNPTTQDDSNPNHTTHSPDNNLDDDKSDDDFFTIRPPPITVPLTAPSHFTNCDSLQGGRDTFDSFDVNESHQYIQPKIGDDRSYDEIYPNCHDNNEQYAHFNQKYQHFSGTSNINDTQNMFTGSIAETDASFHPERLKWRNTLVMERQITQTWADNAQITQNPPTVGDNMPSDVANNNSNNMSENDSQLFLPKSKLISKKSMNMGSRLRDLLNSSGCDEDGDDNNGGEDETDGRQTKNDHDILINESIPYLDKSSYMGDSDDIVFSPDLIKKPEATNLNPPRNTSPNSPSVFSSTNVGSHDDQDDSDGLFSPTPPRAKKSIVNDGVDITTTAADEDDQNVRIIITQPQTSIKPPTPTQSLRNSSPKSPPKPLIIESFPNTNEDSLFFTNDPLTHPHACTPLRKSLPTQTTTSSRPSTPGSRINFETQEDDLNIPGLTQEPIPISVLNNQNHNMYDMRLSLQQYQRATPESIIPGPDATLLIPPQQSQLSLTEQFVNQANGVKPVHSGSHNTILLGNSSALDSNASLGITDGAGATLGEYGGCMNQDGNHLDFNHVDHNINHFDQLDSLIVINNNNNWTTETDPLIRSQRTQNSQHRHDVGLSIGDILINQQHLVTDDPCQLPHTHNQNEDMVQKDLPSSQDILRAFELSSSHNNTPKQRQHGSQITSQNSQLSQHPTNELLRSDEAGSDSFFGFNSESDRSAPAGLLQLEPKKSEQNSITSSSHFSASSRSSSIHPTPNALRQQNGFVFQSLSSRPLHLFTLDHSLPALESIPHNNSEKGSICRSNDLSMTAGTTTTKISTVECDDSDGLFSSESDGDHSLHKTNTSTTLPVHPKSLLDTTPRTSIYKKKAIPPSALSKPSSVKSESTHIKSSDHIITLYSDEEDVPLLAPIPQLTSSQKKPSLYTKKLPTSKRTILPASVNHQNTNNMGGFDDNHDTSFVLDDATVNINTSNLANINSHPSSQANLLPPPSTTNIRTPLRGSGFTFVKSTPDEPCQSSQSKKPTQSHNQQENGSSIDDYSSEQNPFLLSSSLDNFEDSNYNNHGVQDDDFFSFTQKSKKSQIHYPDDDDLFDDKKTDDGKKTFLQLSLFEEFDQLDEVTLKLTKKRSSKNLAKEKTSAKSKKQNVEDNLDACDENTGYRQNSGSDIEQTVRRKLKQSSSKNNVKHHENVDSRDKLNDGATTTTAKSKRSKRASKSVTDVAEEQNGDEMNSSTTNKAESKLKIASKTAAAEDIATHYHEHHIDTEKPKTILKMFEKVATQQRTAEIMDSLIEISDASDHSVDTTCKTANIPSNPPKNLSSESLTFTNVVPPHLKTHFEIEEYRKKQREEKELNEKNDRFEKLLSTLPISTNGKSSLYRSDKFQQLKNQHTSIPFPNYTPVQLQLSTTNDDSLSSLTHSQQNERLEEQMGVKLTIVDPTTLLNQSSSFSQTSPVAPILLTSKVTRTSLKKTRRNEKDADLLMDDEDSDDDDNWFSVPQPAKLSQNPPQQQPPLPPSNCPSNNNNTMTDDSDIDDNWFALDQLDKPQPTTCNPKHDITHVNKKRKSIDYVHEQNANKELNASVSLSTSRQQSTTHNRVEWTNHNSSHSKPNNSHNPYFDELELEEEENRKKTQMFAQYNNPRLQRITTNTKNNSAGSSDNITGGWLNDETVAPINNKKRKNMATANEWMAATISEADTQLTTLKSDSRRIHPGPTIPTFEPEEDELATQQRERQRQFEQRRAAAAAAALHSSNQHNNPPLRQQQAPQSTLPPPKSSTLRNNDINNLKYAPNIQKSTSNNNNNNQDTLSSHVPAPVPPPTHKTSRPSTTLPPPPDAGADELDAQLKQRQEQFLLLRQIKHNQSNLARNQSVDLMSLSATLDSTDDYASPTPQQPQSVLIEGLPVRNYTSTTPKPPRPKRSASKTTTSSNAHVFDQDAPEESKILAAEAFVRKLSADTKAFWTRASGGPAVLTINGTKYIGGQAVYYGRSIKELRPEFLGKKGAAKKESKTKKESKIVVKKVVKTPKKGKKAVGESDSEMSDQDSGLYGCDSLTTSSLGSSSSFHCQDEDEAPKKGKKTRKINKNATKLDESITKSTHPKRASRSKKQDKIDPQLLDGSFYLERDNHEKIPKGVSSLSMNYFDDEDDWDDIYDKVTKDSTKGSKAHK